MVAFLEDLRSRVSSVTLYGSIYKLRRMAEILRRDIDFAWLREIENDLDFLKVPLPKHHRVVLTEKIVQAALTFIEEAVLTQGITPLQRATRVRDGLMVALLALCPIDSGPLLHSASERPSLLSRTAGDRASCRTH